MHKQDILKIVYEYSEEKLNQSIFIPGVSPIPVSGAVLFPEDVMEVADALLEFWYTDWRKCAEFKRRLCGVTGKKHCVLVNSGSSASLIAITAVTRKYNIKHVFTTALGFPTTVYPIFQNNLSPHFLDVNSRTLSPQYNLGFRESNKLFVFAHALGFPFDETTVQDFSYPVDALIADCCFSAGSIVKTKRGDVPIENVKSNDFVLTRYGFQKVLYSGKTGVKSVINKYGFNATPNHPIITTQGVKPLDTLSASDIIFVWNQKKSCIEEKSIKEIRSPNIDSIESTIGRLVLTGFRFIEKFGKIILGQYQKAIQFITKMGIHSITIFPTWNFYLNQNTQSVIGMRTVTTDQLLSMKISNLLGLKPQSGIKAVLEENGIKRSEKKAGKIKRCTKRFVKFARKNILHIFQNALCFVQKNVNTKVEVYNLKIENHPEFFVNNILVHNCDALGAKINYFRGEAGGTVSNRTFDSWNHVGLFADAMTLSFFPAHQITSAEGGAILTDDEELAIEMERLINWGRDCTCLPGQTNTCGKRFNQNFPDLPKGWDHKYTFTELGYNLKMTEFQAALGMSQLTHLDTFVELRLKNYTHLLMLTRWDNYFDFIHIPDWSQPSPFGFPIIVKKTSPFSARELIAHLERNRVMTRRFFGGNLTRQPFIKNLSFSNDNLTETDYIMDNGFWIGCHPQLTENHLDYVLEVFEQFFKEKNLK